MHARLIGPSLVHAGILSLGWDLEWGILIPLVVLAALYFRGVRVVGGVKRVPGLVWFAGGWLVLAASLLSPLHAASEQLFAAHMVQHELLMVVAAPLLALSRPLHVLLDGVPSWLRWRVEALVDRPRARRAWRRLNRPLEAWLIHGVVIWVWHIPVLFEATLSNDAVHAAQHLSFLGSGYLFWASLVADDCPERGGLAVLSLFTTAVHTGVLGALISFARHPWYSAYATRAAAWGMTPLADQQLAGLIMWIPASAAYLIAALLIVRRWLRASETTVSRRESEAFGPIAR
jgi:cytochrome c oxidase assembly factor CtaG